MPTREQVAAAIRVAAYSEASRLGHPAPDLFVDAMAKTATDRVIALFPAFTAEDAALLRRAAKAEFLPGVAMRLSAMADAIDGGAR